MRLSKKATNTSHVKAVSESYFELPERVLQFGTGVLLRGLPDYYIDKANKQNIFKGRIVVVKSTAGNGMDAFKNQDGLYTHCMRGIVDGQVIEENMINSSISRVLSADSEWDSILQCASDPEMQVVISNTTEIGILLVKDSIDANPPVSFPGKLLSFLYRRYQHFNGDESKGMIIIPTELIPENGTELRSVLTELSHQNDLEPAFIKWLTNANSFCNSLVDRIVPGKLPPDQQQEMEDKAGYTDELMIMSEPYGLWAIETNDEEVRKVLSFSSVDPGVVIAPDIDNFRELKLRLLNGSHTFSCGLAHLSGFKTVKQAMNNHTFATFISGLMVDEIAPSITTKNLPAEQVMDFAGKVLDRYRNPYIEHQWLSITLQYTSKMAMRNIPIIKKYFEKFGLVPDYMSFGLAGYLLFMKCQRSADGRYYGNANGSTYLVNDEQAALLSEKWNKYDTGEIAAAVFSDKELWKEDLSKLPGLINAVTEKLSRLQIEGASEMMHKRIGGKQY